MRKMMSEVARGPRAEQMVVRVASRLEGRDGRSGRDTYGWSVGGLLEAPAGQPAVSKTEAPAKSRRFAGSAGGLQEAPAGRISDVEPWFYTRAVRPWTKAPCHVLANLVFNDVTLHDEDNRQAVGLVRGLQEALAGPAKSKRQESKDIGQSMVTSYEKSNSFIREMVFTNTLSGRSGWGSTRGPGRPALFIAGRSSAPFLGEL
ncbi:hypothetical protein V8C37DRAFT_405178 [Trichoderma ceciliae]